MKACVVVELADERGVAALVHTFETAMGTCGFYRRPDWRIIAVVDPHVVRALDFRKPG